MKSIGAAQFKAKCLAILDDVQRSGEPITILKRGRPVARLIPERPAVYPQESLRGTVKFHGDILEPVAAADDWEAEAGA